MFRHRVLALLVAAAALLSACAKSTERPVGPPPLSYIPSVPDSTAAFKPFVIDTAGPNRAKLLSVANGLWIYFHERGTGPLPVPGQTISTHYHGCFDSGKVFDSSYERGQPLTFALGQGQVIRGWDEGFQRIPVGSIAAIILEPTYGYGAGGSPPVIPPDARLVFYVQLVAAQ